MPLKFLLILLCAVPLCAIHAQRPEPDQLKTKDGPLTVHPVYHGTLVLTWNGQTIYIDPHGGAKAFEGLKAPDMILITDIHGDHTDLETLEAIETGGAVMVVPPAVAEKLPEAYQHQLLTIRNGETMKQAALTIEAVPMYNLPEGPDSRHPKGRGNGYILNMGGKRIYISGDTEDIEEMRALRKIDVAFVCMNMPYTMDIHQAASAVLDFKPKIVYPFHYRGSDTEAFKELVKKGNKRIEVRLRDWYGF